MNGVTVVLVLVAWLFSSAPPLPAIQTPEPSASVAAPTVTPQPTATVPTQALTFPAVADAYVFAGRPDLNYGGSVKLRLDADPETTSYVRFSVSGIHSQVVGVALRIYALSKLNAGFSVQAAAADWTESGITYGNRPGAGGPVLGSSGLIPGESWVTVQLGPAIHGDGEYSFVLSTTGTGLAMASREAGAATALMLIVQVAIGPGG
jgi:hypothetical protein